MTGQRGLGLSVAACLLGAALVVLASGRVWAHSVVRAATGARVSISVTGHALSGALPALGVAALVLALAIFAARSWWRRVVGVVVLAVGAGVIYAAFAARADVDAALAQRAFATQPAALHATANGWIWVAVVGGILVAAAGAWVTVFGPPWQSLGRRYEAPAAPAAESGDDATWTALDRGEDPTL